jgi:hypothetical protein
MEGAETTWCSALDRKAVIKDAKLDMSVLRIVLLLAAAAIVLLWVFAPGAIVLEAPP